MYIGVEPPKGGPQPAPHPQPPQDTPSATHPHEPSGRRTHPRSPPDSQERMREKWMPQEKPGCGLWTPPGQNAPATTTKWWAPRETQRNLGEPPDE